MSNFTTFDFVTFNVLGPLSEDVLPCLKYEIISFLFSKQQPAATSAERYPNISLLLCHADVSQLLDVIHTTLLDHTTSSPWAENDSLDQVNLEPGGDSLDMEPSRENVAGTVAGLRNTVTSKFQKPAHFLV